MKYFLYIMLCCLEACEPVKVPRGNFLTQSEITQLNVGKTSSEEVLSLCGSPSFFKDRNTWIYVGGIGEERPLKLHTTTKKTVIVLSFNNLGILQNIDIQKPNIQKNFNFSDSTHFAEKY